MRTVFFSALALVSACNTADRTAPTRVDSAGVEIVGSSGDDRPLQWKLVAADTIDGEVPGVAGTFDFHAALIDTDANGNIFVLDEPESRLLVFGADGKFRRVLGQKGAGPGEFSLPLSFAVDSNGTVGVFDLPKQSLVLFGSDGSVLKERPIGPGFFGGRMHLHGDRVSYDYTGHTETSGIYVHSASTGAVLVESKDGPTRPIELKSCGMGFSGMPRIFEPSYRWDALYDRVVVSYGAEYDLAIYEKGKQVRRIRRNIPPRAATEALAIQELGEGMKVRTEEGPRVCDPREIVAQRGFLLHIPAVGQIQIAPDGSIWVQRGGAEGEQMPTDIFSGDGAYVGTLPPDAPFPAAFLPDSRVLSVIRDDSGTTPVIIYRIEKR